MKPTPWVVSLGIHALVLFAGGLLLRQEVVYGVVAGKSSTEVDLIAAAPDPTPPAPAVQDPEPVIPPDPTPDPDAMVTQAEPPKPIPPTPPPPTSPPTPPKPVPPSPIPPAPEKGDGSAPKPGKSATTLHSDGGSPPTQPSFLRNPLPPYPEEARHARQEGVVILNIDVDSHGRVESAQVKSSSGFPLLDQAAVKGVRVWSFKPATMAGVPVGTRVEVPVRFRLDG